MVGNSTYVRTYSAYSIIRKMGKTMQVVMLSTYKQVRPSATLASLRSEACLWQASACAVLL